METIEAWVRSVVMLDVIAIAAALILGIIIAPLIVLISGVCAWKERFKWLAVCAGTSWFGLWLFPRQRKRGGQEIKRAPTGNVSDT